MKNHITQKNIVYKACEEKLGIQRQIRDINDSIANALKKSNKRETELDQNERCSTTKNTKRLENKAINS